jgi:hypothetical protein
MRGVPGSPRWRARLRLADRRFRVADRRSRAVSRQSHVANRQSHVANRRSHAGNRRSRLDDRRVHAASEHGRGCKPPMARRHSSRPLGQSSKARRQGRIDSSTSPDGARTTDRSAHTARASSSSAPISPTPVGKGTMCDGRGPLAWLRGRSANPLGQGGVPPFPREQTAWALKQRRRRTRGRQNPGGLSPNTPNARSNASPARTTVPSSNSRPSSVTPCSTRRGGLNVGNGFFGSGAQSLRA